MDFDFEKEMISKTNEELLEIYFNQSKYQNQAIIFVKKILAERNIPIEALEKIKTEKDNNDISTFVNGKQGSPLYIAICFCVALFGGIPAIIAGYIYGYSKQIGPDGNKYFVYNESTRKMGKYILLLGIAVVFYYVFKIV